jgi:uncharacterized membrane protein YccC
MIIALYQILIASIILITAFLSRKKYYIATVAISLWTVTHIFVAWLMAIQFGTIIIASLIGLVIVNIRELIERARFRRLQKLLVQNNPTIIYKLGCMYEKGKGVEANKKKAKSYYNEAKLLGSPKAEEALKRIEFLENLPDTIFNNIAKLFR